MIHAVEHLPSKCLALSSNPNTAKKKKKKEINKMKSLLKTCVLNQPLTVWSLTPTNPGQKVFTTER
jgi:hypothetical protein